MNASSPDNQCPQCGSVLPANAPQGLCPRCLLLDAAQPTDPGTGPHGTKILQPAPALDAVRHAFPQLEVLELIGRGGMGVVYKARQKSLNRIVALKLIAPERVADAKFAERFTREAQALAALNHPNIVTIHDFGVASATKPETRNPKPETPFYFLLMEFVDGVNLRQAMKAGRFTPEQALAIVPPVCDALQYAHEHGIVHRDIKPENLLLDRDGRVKIADFGIAKMLECAPADSGQPQIEDAAIGGPTESAGSQSAGATAHTAAGTPQYMAPEQREHHRTDHRADIYSLGVVLYELLTGELPGAKLQPPSRKVQIDVRLDEIVLRALEQRPELRFQTAGEFKTRVETWAAPSAAGVGSAAAQPRSFWPAILLLIVALSVPMVGLTIHNQRMVAESAQRTAQIRQFQTQSTFLSQRLGEANAVAGRAASRAGNDAESEATRAQAREEQLTYQKRAADLQKELDQVHANLVRFSAQPSRVSPWGARLTVLIGVLAGIGALLLRLNPRPDSRNRPGPVPLAIAVAVTSLACVVAGVLLLAAFRFGVVEALIVLGLFVLVAWKWGPASRRSPDVCLRVLAWAAFVLSLPVIALGLYFLAGLLSPRDGWNPGSEEAVVVPLIWLGMLLLPWAGITLWRASKPGEPSKIRHLGFAGAVVLAIGGLTLFGTYLLSHWPLREPAAPASGPEIERVEVTNDQAVVHARGSDGAGMILLFGSGTNRWTPANLYLEAMFDVTMEKRPFEQGVRWIIKLRRGVRWDYQLDDPAGQKNGKVTFHPGTPAPAADGSHVIGEFRPEHGEPLPVAVKLELGKTSPALPAPVSAPAVPSGSVRQRFIPQEGMANKTSWSVWDKPSFLNPDGWAFMTRMTLGGTAWLWFPGEKERSANITLVKGDDDAITIRIEDLRRNSTMTLTLPRGKPGEITVDGTGYRVLYMEVNVNPSDGDTSPFAHVLVTPAGQPKPRRFDEGKGWRFHPVQEITLESARGGRRFFDPVANQVRNYGGPGNDSLIEFTRENTGELFLRFQEVHAYEVPRDEEKRYWQEMSAEEFIRMSNDMFGALPFERNGMVPLRPAELPRMFWMQGLGLLHVLSITDDAPARVQIRHKLVDPESASTPAPARADFGEPATVFPVTNSNGQVLTGLLGLHRDIPSHSFRVPPTLQFSQPHLEVMPHGFVPSLRPAGRGRVLHNYHGFAAFTRGYFRSPLRGGWIPLGLCAFTLN